MRAWKLGGLMAVLGLGLAVLVWAGMAQAAAHSRSDGPPITVCPADCDYTTISAAVAAAPAGSVIDVAAGTYVETLVLTKSLAIQGAGSAATIVDANLSGRVLSVIHGTQVTITGLALVNGSESAPFEAHAYGGGIRSEGDLWLDGVLVADNQVRGGDTFGFITVGYGGGIYNGCAPAGCGRLTVYNSLIRGNLAHGGDNLNEDFGGNAFGGGIYNGCRDNAPHCPMATISNTIIMDNETVGGLGGIPPSGGCGPSGSGHGGGIYNGFGLEPGRLSLFNTTIVQNNASSLVSDCGAGGGGSGGGIYNQLYPVIAPDGVMGVITAHNTLVANNLISETMGIQGADCQGALVSAGYNLIGYADGCMLEGDLTGVLINVDARLNLNSPLPELIIDSPAIDAGDPAGCPAVDYRGATRPADGDNDGTAICDIGALEFPHLPHTLFLPAVFYALPN